MANSFYVVETLLGSSTSRIVPDADGGIDTLIIQGAYALNTDIRLAWTFSGPDGTVPFFPTSASGFFFNPGNIGNRLTVLGQIENAIGGTGRDHITGNILNNVLMGEATTALTGGNDTIFGDDGNDTLFGMFGNDVLNGAEDDDRIFGGAGNDVLFGGSGTDVLNGGAGADSLSGGADGRDMASYATSGAGVRVDLSFGTTTTGLLGDAEGDRLTGIHDLWGSAFGDVFVDLRKDNIAFGYNANRFFGADGADRLFMGGGNDYASGGNGADSLWGENGNDTLLGDAGNDLLIGGAGMDQLTGGAGADVFMFVNASDTRAPARDIITDFAVGVDDISLARIDANSLVAGDQAFSFIGAAAFGGVAGQVRASLPSAGVVVVQGDLNGDRVTDFTIAVMSGGKLSASDFIL